MLETLENNFIHTKENSIRIVCPFIKYEKSVRFELFFNKDSQLLIKLYCHNHILPIVEYFKYYFDKISPKNDYCYEHSNYKTIAFCSSCSRDICEKCLKNNHSDHDSIPLSTNIKDNDNVGKEKDNLLLSIENLKDLYTKTVNLNEKQKMILETLYYFYLIKKIVYFEYFQELRLQNFSMICIRNLKYIRKIKNVEISKIKIDINTNVENIIKIDKKSNKNYLEFSQNTINDNVMEEKKITTKTYSNYAAGNCLYFITISQKIYIYSMTTEKLLCEVDENESINIVQFHPNYTNIFLTVSN